MAARSKRRATARTKAPRSWSGCRCSVRVAVVEPRLRRIRIAAAFPESLAVAVEELDPADPLRPFPRIQLRRDHPHRAAMFARQRATFPGVDEQDVVFDRTRERKV